MLPFIIFIVFVSLLIACLIGQPFYRSYRRNQIRNRPFPDAWRKILRQRVPYFRRLPADIQLQLKRHIQVFIAEKVFVGCNGISVTDDMRVTIAAHACLLILNRPTDYYPSLRQILIYPGPFIVDKAEADSAGVIHHQRRVLTGESWSQGQVILSWEDAVEDAATIDDGHNVVIHEFAHQLDMETGSANGAPQLSDHRRYTHWSNVLSWEFAALQDRALTQEHSLLNHYGATNPAEFFAVSSEVFFEQPQQLLAQSPLLYEELRAFYCVNPTDWQAM
jgi:Mlc titration factor MtfA (ptsG expression regulator)